jgi:DNA-directed RNA polymerase specialized sigma24 family protein
MKAKEYLRRHAGSQLKIKALEEEINRIRESGLQSPANDGQPRGTDISDTTGRIAAKVADLCSDVEFLWEQQNRIKWQVERALYSLENPEQFRVCWLKYIDLKEWAEIAAEMDRTERTVQRIHGNALQEVQKYIDKLDSE